MFGLLSLNVRGLNDSGKRSVISLVLKRARRIGSQSVRRKTRGAGARITDARRASMQIFLKVLHISQSMFCINKLDKCIKNVIRHQCDY